MNIMKPNNININPKINEIVFNSGPGKTVQAKPFKTKPVIKLKNEIINRLLFDIFILQIHKTKNF